MLESIRAVQNTWVGKTVLTGIMGLILVSFVIWGIGPVFNGFNANALATVGSDTVTVEAFRQAFQTELQQLQQRTRRPITSAQAHQYGIDTRVLSRLVSDAVLDDRARSLGLAISQSQIVKAITTDPAFAGPNGQFDRDRFTQLLRENDMNEQGFVRDQRNVDLRQELIQGLVGGLAAPQAATEALHALQTETRSIDAVTLQGSAVDLPVPDEARLQTFFAARADTFRAPDYRKLVVLPILPSTVAQPDAVSEADVQALYDRTKDTRFSTPETRSVQQIVFPDAQEAAAAAASVKAGRSFADLATERKLTDKDIDLGRVTRTGAYDKGVADAAFALPADGVSEPVATAFGAALVHVTGIEPGGVKPLAEVATALRLEIANGRTGEAIRTRHDTVEEARAAGRSLTEAAKAAGLAVTVVDAVDATGLGPDGQPVALPDGPALLKAAFASDVGVDNDTLRTPEGGEIFFEVAGIEPARPKTLAEVRPAVEAAWRADEAGRTLADAAAAMVKAIEAGKSLDELAAASGGLPVQHVADVRRSGGTGLAPAVAAAVFDGPVGHAGSAVGEGNTRVVFKVLGTVVPALDPDSPDVKAMASQYQAALADEVVTTYLNDAQSRLGVRINPAAFSAAIGGG